MRLMCHASAILMTWGILIILSRRGIAEEEGNPSTSTPTTTVTACAGLLSIALYLDLFHFLYAVLPGVSVPSGPREHKIQRTPAWANTQWTIDALFPNNNTKKQGRTPQWRFATGSDAHAVSEETFAGTSAALTGEAAGRDIWTTSSSATTTKNNSSSRVEEALVQEMASGGRPPGFNPHVNPNWYAPSIHRFLLWTDCSIVASRHRLFVF